ncbi:surface exclusion protein [Salmonella enterica subsp. enterica serovar Sarajane]|nr:surface exclusion protein [Salmonella enterica]OIN32744.1 surface exclusion protein [Salmonella enterica subsp. enterica serovar Sarajane]
MKNLVQIILVTVVQFIACYLAGWGGAETGFILFFVMLWQGLFIWLFIKIRKKQDISCEFKFSKGIWYVIMPLCSLLSPLLSLMVFIGGVLYELRRVSGCISIKEWMKYQLDEQPYEKFCLDFDHVDFHHTNPATGLPMSGIGVDIGGNSYGYNSKNYEKL